MNRATHPRTALYALGVLLLAGCASGTSAVGDPGAAAPAAARAAVAPATRAAAAPPAAPAARVAAAESSTSPTTPATTPADCTGDLRLTSDTPTGAAGHLVVDVHVANTGATSCSPSRWLVVSATSDGAETGAPATRQPGSPTAPLVLAPGQTAGAVIVLGNSGLYDPDDCAPRQVDALQVSGAGLDPTSVPLPSGTTACSSRSIAELSVSALRTA